MPLPLSSFLMLVVCMTTDVFGSLALVYEKAEGDVMKRPPRDVHKCVFFLRP
jgi:sodium/potassium-transporting ATPase subunit alpha